MRVGLKLLVFFLFFIVNAVAFDYQSSWINKDPNTRGIKAIYITNSGTIRVLGYCNNRRCDWGSAKYTRIPNGLIASWRYKNEGHKVISVVSTEANEVQVVSKYLYNGIKRDSTKIALFQSGTLQNISAKATMSTTKNSSNTQGSVASPKPQATPAQNTQVIQPTAQQRVTPSAQTVPTTQQSSLLTSTDNYFVGKWVGDDPFNRSITRLQVSASNGGLVATIWGRGRCYPKECSWGRHKLVKSGDSFTTRWMQGDIDKTLKISGIYKVANGSFRMIRAKTTSRLKTVQGPKSRTSYLKKYSN